MPSPPSRFLSFIMLVVFKILPLQTSANKSVNDLGGIGSQISEFEASMIDLVRHSQ